MNRAKGSALIGALAAVTVAGVVGTAMIASYDIYVKKSRGLYVRTLMNALDQKIRYMASQPQAYLCGSEAGVGNDQGMACTIRPDYFGPVDQTIVPGAACPTTAPCGFRLIRSGPDGAGHDYGFRTEVLTNPLTGDSETTGVFNYQLVYEGSEIPLVPGGRDLRGGMQFGMTLPREILQSNSINCATAYPDRPVFQGFGADGRVRCSGFSVCARGQYASSVDMKSLTVRCRPFATADKQVDCAGGNRMIASLKWNAVPGKGSQLVSSCADLPAAPFATTTVTTTTRPTPVNGACGAANGVEVASAPSTQLCSAGNPTAVAGAGPFTWSCNGIDGGSNAACTAPLKAAPKEPDNASLWWTNIPANFGSAPPATSSIPACAGDPMVRGGGCPTHTHLEWCFYGGTPYQCVKICANERRTWICN